MDGLETVEALNFARLPRWSWKVALSRGMAPWAPTTTKGVARVFDPTALTAAFCLGQMLEHEVVPRVAGKVAEDIHQLILRDRSIMRLSAWKVFSKRGKPPRVVVAEKTPAKDAIELFRFEIAAIHMRALDSIRARMKAAAQ